MTSDNTLQDGADASWGTLSGEAAERFGSVSGRLNDFCLGGINDPTSTSHSIDWLQFDLCADEWVVFASFWGEETWEEAYLDAHPEWLRWHNGEMQANLQELAAIAEDLARIQEILAEATVPEGLALLYQRDTSNCVGYEAETHLARLIVNIDYCAEVGWTEGLHQVLQGSALAALAGMLVTEDSYAYERCIAVLEPQFSIFLTRRPVQDDHCGEGLAINLYGTQAMDESLAPLERKVQQYVDSKES